MTTDYMNAAFRGMEEAFEAMDKAFEVAFGRAMQEPTTKEKSRSEKVLDFIIDNFTEDEIITTINDMNCGVEIYENTPRAFDVAFEGYTPSEILLDTQEFDRDTKFFMIINDNVVCFDDLREVIPTATRHIRNNLLR